VEPVALSAALVVVHRLKRVAIFFVVEPDRLQLATSLSGCGPGG